MTRTHTQRNLIAASAFGVVSALMMFAQAGQASAATSVLSCEGSNRGAVLQCCETQVKKSGLPLWMRQMGAHCSSLRIEKMVKCAANTHANKRCKLVMLKAEDEGNELEQGNKDGRDNNGRGNGKGKR